MWNSKHVDCEHGELTLSNRHSMLTSTVDPCWSFGKVGKLSKQPQESLQNPLPCLVPVKIMRSIIAWSLANPMLMLTRVWKVAAIWEAPKTSTSKSCESWCNIIMKSFIHALRAGHRTTKALRAAWHHLSHSSKHLDNLDNNIYRWGAPSPGSIQIEAPKLVLANP